jgi:hypothetical protein
MTVKGFVLQATMDCIIKRFMPVNYDCNNFIVHGHSLQWQIMLIKMLLIRPQGPVL